jgi:hypothetical protein
MSHDCPGPGHVKAVSVADDLLACPPHWYQVPADVRRRVWAAWRNGNGAGSRAHAEAIAKAVEHMKPLHRQRRGA